MKQLLATIFLSGILTGNLWAHGDAAQKSTSNKKTISTEETAFGREGDPKQTTRTLHVDMSDKMRFTPSDISIKRGETIRFTIKNSGKLMHEFVLGNLKELKEHAELMKKHPGMEHDEPYMAHVAPGKTQTVVWQFTKAGEFNFGCLLPGHFEAGMIGKVTVR